MSEVSYGRKGKKTETVVEEDLSCFKGIGLCAYLGTLHV